MTLSKFNFDTMKVKLEKSRRDLLVLLSNQAQNYFSDSFKKQGFNGEKWKEVQRRNSDINPKTGKQYSAYLYPKKKGLQRRTSPILVGAGYKHRGGVLRRAVSNMARTAEINNDKLRMIVDLPYAKIQNEGGIINMPARQSIIHFNTNKKGQTRFSTVKKARFAQKVNVGTHQIKIDKREFVGQTQELTNKQKELIDKTINKIWEA
jgi:hypothetical protein